MEVSSQLHAPAALLPGKKPPGTHWIGGWVDPRAGMDDVEKRKFLTLLGLELQPLGRPARSQSLYRLRYPGSLLPFHSSTIYICRYSFFKTYKLLYICYENHNKSEKLKVNRIS
jgi:hypothetical protein